MLVFVFFYLSVEVLVLSYMNNLHLPPCFSILGLLPQSIPHRTATVFISPPLVTQVQCNAYRLIDGCFFVFRRPCAFLNLFHSPFFSIWPPRGR